MKIIAFVAPKQHGKTTACKYLESKYGAVRVSFKDALIAELKEKFPLVLTQMAYHYGYMNEDILFEDKPLLVRRLMQEYGTNVRRGDNPNYWVEAWYERHFDEVTNQDRLVVVDDVRFLNEARAVKLKGGTLIRITRTDMDNTDTHQSETEQQEIQCDYEIVCHGGDEDKLYAELDAIMQK